jgi:hypothetical protein
LIGSINKVLNQHQLFQVVITRPSSSPPHKSTATDISAQVRSTSEKPHPSWVKLSISVQQSMIIGPPSNPAVRGDRFQSGGETAKQMVDTLL